MAGSTFGWAVMLNGRAPSKSYSPTVSRSQVSSVGRPPSISARIRSACRMTLVLAVFLAKPTSGGISGSVVMGADKPPNMARPWDRS